MRNKDRTIETAIHFRDFYAGLGQATFLGWVRARQIAIIHPTSTSCKTLSVLAIISRQIQESLLQKVNLRHSTMADFDAQAAKAIPAEVRNISNVKINSMTFTN